MYVISTLPLTGASPKGIVRLSCTSPDKFCKPTRFKGRLSSDAAIQRTLLVGDGHPPFYHLYSEEDLGLPLCFLLVFIPPFRPGLSEACITV